MVQYFDILEYGNEIRNITLGEEDFDEVNVEEWSNIDYDFVHLSTEETI